MAAELLRGTALVTGAASGIGQATSFAFAKHGINTLALADLNEDNLAVTSAAITTKYPNVQIVTHKLDVCDVKAVEAWVAEAAEKFRRIDIAVNVAGIAAAPKATDEEDSSTWDKVLDVNLNGVWRCQRAELKAMLKQEDLGIREGRGTIINAASMYGLVVGPPHLPIGPYTVSKHGVVGLTKTDAITYASKGIRINAICPGYVNTPLIAAAVESGAMDSEIARTPMGRLAHVDEIADSIVYLASSMASFVTGSCLVVDGGYTVN